MASLGERVPSDPSPEKTPEQPPQKEYSFEEGAKELENRILALLQTQDIVVIGINGAGPNVGKTSFTGRIAAFLMGKDIPYIAPPYPGALKARAPQLFREQKNLGVSKGVILLQAYDQGSETPKKLEILRKDADIRLQDEIADYNSIVQKEQLPETATIDLWIAIYNTDKPFDPGTPENPHFPLGDIIIKSKTATEMKINEAATKLSQDLHSSLCRKNASAN